MLRTYKTKYFDILTKSFLVSEYVIKKKLIKEISNITKCSTSTIRRYLKKYEIPFRTINELISQSLINRKLSKTHINNIRKITTGVKQSKETIEKRVFKTKGQKRPKTSISLTGRKFSKETIEKMSKAKLGKNLSKEHIESIRKAQTGKTQEKAQNWKGGLTSFGVMIRNLRENRNWGMSVFKRDDYICQQCGDRTGI